jgi:uncharacterized membrane protein
MAGNDPNQGTAKAIYILYLISPAVPLTGLIGVILAYVYREKVENWLVSHFRYQIRTFWIGLFYTLIGLFTTFILIGYLFLLFTFVWWIVRCVKGMQQLDQEVEVENTSSWMF